MKNFIKDCKEIFEYKEMLLSLVKRELRSRYKGSFLGFLWTFLTPLLQILVYTLVFTRIFPNNIENYTVFLVVGLLPWNCFTSTLIAATASIVNNSSLVTKIYFPKIILPLSKVITFIVDYLYSLVILLIIIILSNINITVHFLWFPFILIVQMLFTIGISLVLSALYVKIRDLLYIVNVVTMLWFYLSPVFYDISAIPSSLGALYFLNPMVSNITSYRNIFIYEAMPDFLFLGYSLCFSLVLCVLGYKIFKACERVFAEEI